ncbi:MAG: protein translocase subunit SecF, partial [Streptosporangiaceae bacterium]
MMSRLGEVGGKLYRGEVSINFVGRQRLWYAMSGLILLVSIVALFTRGLDFSVDFKGGAVFTFAAPSSSISQVENAVEAGGVSGAIVQQVKTGDKVNWEVQTKSLTGPQTVKLEQDMSSQLGVNSNNITAKTVGPLWGSQISTKATEALIAFLIVIVIYLSIAFEWKMAIAAFVALIHDLVIATGVYALAGFQVSPAT